MYQTVSPIYTEKLGRIGAGGGRRSHLSDQALSPPTQLAGPFYGADGAGRGFAGTAGQLWQVRMPLVGVRGTRGVGSLGQVGEDPLGPGGWTIATVVGAGMGGSIVGFVATKGSKDGVYRGGFFSAALAAFGASFGHLKNDQSKLFGASLLLASLWGLSWALRPMVGGGGGAAAWNR